MLNVWSGKGRETEERLIDHQVLSVSLTLTFTEVKLLAIFRAAIKCLRYLTTKIIVIFVAADYLLKNLFKTETDPDTALKFGKAKEKIMVLFFADMPTKAGFIQKWLLIFFFCQPFLSDWKN